MLGKYHGLFTNKFDVDMTTPVFVDDIEKFKGENNLSEDNPKAVFHIDDIPKKE